MWIGERMGENRRDNLSVCPEHQEIPLSLAQISPSIYIVLRMLC
jgi:hypothetical protein